jgi:DNA-binding winged helix-turn-helix (wHTH) protein
LGESLQAWHGASRSLGVDSLDRLYRERLELEPAQVGREALETRVHALVRQIPLLNAQARLQAGKFEIQFDGRVYAYPDPLPLLYQTFERETPPIVINTPGVLSGDNILTDAKGRCWLTDFAGAGLAPLLWNYVSLEAVVRFDWVEEKDLRALHTMEQCLVGDLFGKLDTAHVEPFLRKPVRVIESIRRGAGEAVGKDTREYNLGMLFHAMRGLVGLDPHVALTPGELARFSHRLMAAAMIAAQLASTEGAQAVPVKSDFWLDKGNQTVWIEGKPVQLRGQGYEILCYLYDNANRLCKRREIIEQVLGGAYDEDQVRRLTTAINRLRDDIEPNPRKPRYLQTHPGAGYVLEIKNKA